MQLRAHQLRLTGERVVLRPMTEDFWNTLARWNADPEILWYTEGDDVAAYSLQEVQSIYREISQSAYCFIIELDGDPIGECWLQEMNLGRILSLYPTQDCRRIDIMIGEKVFWGRGHGTDAIKTLVRFAFEQEHVVMVFACDIADYNGRSLRAFEKAGFRVHAKWSQPPDGKSKWTFDLVLARSENFESKDPA